MFFAAATLIASVVCAAVYAAEHHESARVLAIVAASALSLINLGGVAFFIWDALCHRRATAKHRLRNTILRVLDHYTAINAAWALVLLTIWMWGQRESPNTYLFVIVPSAQSSVFAAWVSTLRGAFGVWLTVGSPSIQPRVTFAEMLFLLYYWLAWVLPVVFLGAIISAALERLPAEKAEEELEL